MTSPEERAAAQAAADSAAAGGAEGHSGAKTGQRLAGYRVGERLAVGGMAEVFAGESADGQAVVLKVLLPQLRRDADFVQMLADEATLTERLDHPHLVRTLDHHADAPPFLVMERVDGCTLDDLLADGAMEIGAALRVGEALLEALDYIHGFCDEQGRALDIVHRDVSAGNVLLGRDGAIKLADFGIARSLLRHQRTRTGIIKGTVRYMSPEQVAGGEIDKRSDLYSVGVLLFQMLTGEQYISADREIELLQKAAEPELRAPSEVDSALPQCLDKLLRPALQAFPEQRYRDAAAMLARLRRVAGELEVALDDDGASDEALRERVEVVYARRPSARPIDDAAMAATVAQQLDAASAAEQREPVSSGRGMAKARSGHSSALIAMAMVGVVVVGMMVMRSMSKPRDGAKSKRRAAVGARGRLGGVVAKGARGGVAKAAALAGTGSALAGTGTGTGTGTLAGTGSAVGSGSASGSASAAGSASASARRARPKHRVRTARRARRARVARAGSGAGSGSAAPKATPATTSAASATFVAALRARLAGARKVLRGKGLGLRDLPAAARGARSRAAAALAKGDLTVARAEVTAFENAANAAQVTPALVRAKLKRADAALRKASARADAAALRRRASTALQLLMDGRYRKANRELDALLGALGKR